MSFLCRLGPFQPSDATALARIFTEPQVREYLGGPMHGQAAAKRVGMSFERELERFGARQSLYAATPDGPNLPL